MRTIRKTVFVVLCLSLIFILTGQTSFPQTYYISVRQANARSCPQTTCEIVAQLSRGTPITVEGTETGASVSGNRTWLRFTYNGATAYVHSSLATTRNPNSSGGGTTGGGSTGASCNGARTCSQMTSCAQAQACLAAGRTSLDRDRDGVPCENICPGG